MRLRVAVACAVAGLTACYVWFAATRQPDFISDFDQLWFAAREVLAGRNPYETIGPGRPIDTDFPLFYPMTAVMLAVPLAWMDVVWARVVWVAVPAGALCYLVTRDGFHRLPMFLSGCFLSCALNAQWTVLLLCALYSPVVAGVVSGKPNVGAVAMAGAPHAAWMHAIGGGLLLTVIGLFFVPAWPLDWLAAVREGEHFAPYVLRPFGFVLLLAGLRWREPSARVLLALAVVPHTAAVYEGLWAFTAARTFRQSLVLAILSHAALFLVTSQWGDGTFPEYVEASATAVLALLYVPMLVLILRRPSSDHRGEGARPAPARPAATAAREREVEPHRA